MSIVNRSKCSEQRMNFGVKSARISGSGMRASSVGRSSVRVVTARDSTGPPRQTPVQLKVRHMKRRFLAAAMLLGRLPLARCAQAPPGRVVILGFDGVDSQVVEQMLAAGRLPNLAALEGARRLLAADARPCRRRRPFPGRPSRRGSIPGGHEIFDFLKRDPADRVPTFAVAEETTAPFLFGKSNPVVLGARRGARLLARRGACSSSGAGARSGLVVLARSAARRRAASSWPSRAWLPAERPGVKNNRRGRDVLERAGRAAGDGDADAGDVPAGAFRDGRLLSGLGVPDISGRIGKPAFYTSDPFFAPREGNDFSIELVRLESNSGRSRRRSRARPASPSGARARSSCR